MDSLHLTTGIKFVGLRLNVVSSLSFVLTLIPEGISIGVGLVLKVRMNVIGIRLIGTVQPSQKLSFPVICSHFLEL